MQIIKYTTAYHIPREPSQMSVDVEGYNRIRREEIWWIWLSTMLWATWHNILHLIGTIPLCQKAHHQSDHGPRRRYRSQKQRQMPYPLQAMIYCQSQWRLHLLFHEERVSHQKPWDGYIITCSVSEESWSWSSTNRGANTRNTNT